MRDDDGRPADDRRTGRNRDQVEKCVPREEVVEKDDNERHPRGDEDAAYGHPAVRELAECLRCIAALCESVEHTAVAVDRGVVDRDRRREYNEIQDMRRRRDADVAENLDKGARIRTDLVPWPECHKNRHGADVEDEDTPDDLIDRLRDGAVGILCLPCCDADELDAAEREHDDRRCKEEAPPAVRQESPMRPEIADVLGERCARHEQPAAEPDHEHNRRDLDECHPELHLAIGTHIREIEDGDDRETDERREPLRQIGQPKIHIDADRRQLRHGNNDVVEPVVPAGEEARKVAPVLSRIVTERAGDRLIHRHLAEHPHDEENHDAAEQICEHDRRPRERDRRDRAVEKPRADRAAEGDHLEMPVLEPTPKGGRCFLFLHKSSVQKTILSALTRF